MSEFDNMDIDEEFRKMAELKFGKNKGALKKAFEEAIQNWMDKNES